jgi:hypothetical protein
MWLRRVLVFFALLIWSNDASASLYCLIDFNGRRCNYQDMASCQQAAGSQGECVLNRGEMIAPVGGAPFCLVEKWKTECIFQNRSSCERQSQARHASCIANPNLTNQKFEGGWSRPSQNQGNTQPKWGQQQPRDGKQKRDRYLPSPGYDPRPGSR